jgi:penicillin-binding protein 1A
MGISKGTKRFWKLYIIFIVGIFLFFALLKIGLFGALPNINELENPKSKLASELISSDGTLFGKYYLQNRTIADFDEINENLTNALIATEDRRFFKHSGIDWKGLARAIAGAGRDGGASTITQQLAKNLFHIEDRRSTSKIGRILQKFKEWIIAVQLEQRYTKKEIIALYLNTVQFSGHSFGIKAASKEFFNKSPDKLDLIESATLVGTLKAITKYNPRRNPENSKNRRNVVLNQMVKYDYLPKEEYNKLKNEETTLNYVGQSSRVFMAQYLKDVIGNRLKEWCKSHKKPNGENYNIYKDGLKIYTTVDSRMQEHAEKAVAKHLKKYQKLFYRHWGNSAPWRDDKWRVKDSFIVNKISRTSRYKELKRKYKPNSDSMFYYTRKHKYDMTVFSWNGDIDTSMTLIDSLSYYQKFLHAGFVGVEPSTGEVKFWVGGMNHNFFKYDHVTGFRQPGSTFKPFVYSLALDYGIAPCGKIPNSYISLPRGGGKRWIPKNSGGGYGGPVNMFKALGYSMNVPTVHLMLMLGENGDENLVKYIQKMGVTGRKINPNIAMCLGTEDMSPLEMASAYTTFANKGFWIEPRFISRIEDKAGNIIAEFNPTIINQVLTEEKASIVLELMKGVVKFGTSKDIWRRFGIKGTVAGKTGTTDQNSDAWFMGVTKNLVTATWVGADSRWVRFRSTGLGQGAKQALPIYGYFMQSALKDKRLNLTTEDFDEYEGSKNIETDCSKYGTITEDEGGDFADENGEEEEENLFGDDD